MELNDFIKKLNNLKKKADLKGERKKAMRARVLYLINLQEKPKANPASFFFPILRPVPILAGVLALVLAGGTISFAAENSVPGDILYPIKINVNENLIGAVQFTPANKASWEVDKTERRLSEASAIFKGKANPAAQAQVTASFDATANQAQASIQLLNGAGNATTAAELAANLEAVLKAHEQILSAVVDDHATTSSMALEDKISDKLSQVESIKAAIQAKIATIQDSNGVNPEAQNGINKAKDKIDSVRKFVKDNSDKLSIEAAKDADQSLSDASNAVNDAQDKLKNDMGGEAFNSANDAGEEAQKVQLLLQAKLNLGIITPGSGSAAATSQMSSSTSATSTPNSTSTSN